MNESAPAPARPPVPWWERVAAGVLPLIAIVWFRTHGVVWWEVTSRNLQALWGFWQSVLHWLFGSQNSGVDPAVLLDHTTGGMWLAIYGSLPAFLGVGLVVASGRYRHPSRGWLWWTALGQGVLYGLALLAEGRGNALRISPNPGQLSWTDGWLTNIDFSTLRAAVSDFWWSPVYMLLATAVLGYGCWKRRRG